MNKSTQVTIYDVAEDAGVSIATVSRVLNTPERVSKKSREKVLASIYPVDSLARLHGYYAMLPLTRRLDGLIVVSLPISETEIGRLQQSDIPAVFIENRVSGFSSIEIDDCAFISLIVPLMVFFSLQRYFVRGLLAGSVKG